jgi:hypothetical protein
MTQANEGARRAIIEKLTTPTDTASRDAALAKAMPGQSRVVAYVRSGGEGADPASVIVRKERRSGRHYVAAVEWVSGEGQAMEGVFSLTSDDSGQWECRGYHSGSVGGDPVRGRPWVNLGAGGDPFYLGGRVVESDVAVAVRIRFSNGLALDDVAGPDGIVLFPSAGPPPPGWSSDTSATAELLGLDGSVVARHRLTGRADPV